MKDIIDNYKHIVFNKYAMFEGRAARTEFWYFVLANLLISTVLGLIEGMFDGSHSMTKAIHDDSILADIYSLLVLVPSLAVAARRLHDIDKSGWWMLVPFYNIYLFAKKGIEGNNRFDTPTETVTQPTPIPLAPPVSDQPQ